MDIFYKIVAMLGGLSMFLYGMRLMGDGLKSSSGTTMKDALAKVTNKPFLGFILGMLVTAIIQSSTATIVLTVGLVGAGFLTYKQSIGVVLGANVGTAITAQIIRLMDVSSDSSSIIYFFKSDNLAPLALIIGIVLIMFVKKSSAKNVGNIASGFGILFVGLMAMSDAVSAFGESLTGLLLAFENNYILQFIAGVGVTGVIQSSSAVVGILQSVASSVGVTFSGVFAVIIGVNIGDCITTFLVSRIGARPAQVRTALVHVIYNIFAASLTIIGIILLRKFNVLDDEFFAAKLNAGGVANVHGIFRLVPAILLLPFSNLFGKIAEKIAPDKPMCEEDEQVEKDLNELDSRLITSPALALSQSRHLIGHMSDIALHNFDAAVKQIYEFDPERDARIDQREDILDRITDASNKYVVSIAPYVTLEKDNKMQNYQLKTLICFERIGDLAVNINDAVKNLREAKIEFSKNAMAELRVAIDACYEILDITCRSFKNNDYELATEVEPLEEVIDELIENLNNRHIYRMSNNLCDGMLGIQFQNILTNLEHISDKCSDLAVYILEQKYETILGNEHEYIHNLHHSSNSEYQRQFEFDYKKYFNQLDKIPAKGSFK